ncbi:MAG: hypothetical protein KGL39_02395 [Patescibacteria group bacterium]|nr:hypothetical protein [Patescibacteria group bacterium]
MSEDKIIKSLSALKSVQPDGDFTMKSRAVILSSARGHIRPALAPKAIAGRVLDMGLSLALMSALVITVLSGVGLISGRNAAVTPVLNSGLTNDASAAIQDINVHLSDVQYFNAESAKTNTALKAAAGKAVVPTAAGGGQPSIDSLLNQAAQ